MSNQGTRLHYMDMLRGMLMLLGVVLHTLAIYQVDTTWKVRSLESVSYAAPILEAIHLFRMPAFFMISGYFSALLLSREKGRLDYARDRLLRLGIPLLFAGVLFNLPLSSIIQNGPVQQGWFEYFFSAAWLGHLWFLSVLIIYSAVAALLWKNLKRILTLEIPYYWLAALLILAILAPLSIRVGWVIDGLNAKLLFLDIVSTFEYAPYFIFGLVLFFQHSNMNLGKNLPNLLGATLLVGFLWFKVDLALLNDAAKFMMTSLFSFTLFSFFERYFNKPATWKRNLAESSYTIYLIHQPIIILLGFYLVKSTVNIHLQIILIMTITSIFALWLHFNLVKKNQYAALFFNGHTNLKRMPK